MIPFAHPFATRIAQATCCSESGWPSRRRVQVRLRNGHVGTPDVAGNGDVKSYTSCHRIGQANVCSIESKPVLHRKTHGCAVQTDAAVHWTRVRSVGMLALLHDTRPAPAALSSPPPVPRAQLQPRLLHVQSFQHSQKRRLRPLPHLPLRACAAWASCKQHLQGLS